MSLRLTRLLKKSNVILGYGMGVSLQVGGGRGSAVRT